MPEGRSRWSSRLYGRYVGKAISASTGGVKRMLTKTLAHRSAEPLECFQRTCNGIPVTRRRDVTAERH
jgi:hypothetical protein